MTPGCLRWFSHLFVGLLLGALSGCAALVPPAPSPWLHDALFDHPPRPAEADGVMALDEPMRRYLDGVLAGAVRDKGRARALTDALYAQDDLQLEYDSSTTRNAAQAFAARSGNCLSLVLMTAALARELGLSVSYQSATAGEYYSRQGNLTLQAGHVNLVLAPRQSRWTQNGIHYLHDGDALRIDFLPSEQLRGQRSVPISEQRVLAMFMNNRAVESLQHAPLALAYAWAREALRLDPGFWTAYNTLGVIYQRRGLGMAAERAYAAALARDDRHKSALQNMAKLLEHGGRAAEAALFTARLAQLERDPPFAFFDRGVAAAKAGDFRSARELIQRELRRDPDYHEFHFWLAVALYGLGEVDQARTHLSTAMKNSTTRREQALYASKLQRLAVSSGSPAQ